MSSSVNEIVGLYPVVGRMFYIMYRVKIRCLSSQRGKHMTISEVGDTFIGHFYAW